MTRKIISSLLVSKQASSPSTRTDDSSPMKLSPLMESHIKVMNQPENSYYFNFQELGKEKLPVVALDLETPYIGGNDWYWECAPTAWSYYTDDASIVSWISLLVKPGERDTTTPNGGVYVYDESHRAAIQWILDNTTTVYHNSSFDLQRLEQNGYIVPVPGDYQDTMLMAYALNYKYVGLWYLAKTVGMVKVDVNTKDFDNLTKDVLARCLSDTEITLKLYGKLSQELKSDNRAYHHYIYVDLPFSRVIRAMEHNGFYIDLDGLNDLHQDLLSQHTQLENDLWKQVKYVSIPDKIKVFKSFHEVDSRGCIAGKPSTPVTANGKHRSSDNDDDDKDTEVYLLNNQPEYEGYLTAMFCPIHWGKWATNDTIEYPTGYTLKNGKPQMKRVKGSYVYKVHDAFNPNSPAHKVAALVSQGWDTRNALLSDSGNVKCDKDVLKSLASRYPLAKTLSELGKVSKLLSSFTTPILSKTIPTDKPGIGLLRGNYKQARTATGRLSSANPNLQNIPARGEMGKKLRSLFIAPPIDDMVMIGGDDDQIEARIFADLVARLCDDWSFVELFRHPAKPDFHMENALSWGLHEIMLELMHPDWTPTRVKRTAERLTKLYRGGRINKMHPILKMARDCEKTCIYGVLYGAGVRKLGATAYGLAGGSGDNFAVGTLIFESMPPSVRQLKEMVWSACRGRGGKIYNLYGKRAYYPGINSSDGSESSRAERQSFNCVIQGTSFGRLATRLLGIWWVIEKYGVKIAAMIHDEFIMYVPLQHVKTVTAILSEWFSHPDCFQAVPVNFQFTQVESWAEKG
jgi:DNA polymerase I-like protein with 3'-5' exonuclease and polymerase domains